MSGPEPTVEKIFNKVTANGNREMTLERFKQACEEYERSRLQAISEEVEEIDAYHKYHHGWQFKQKVIEIITKHLDQ